MNCHNCKYLTKSETHPEVYICDTDEDSEPIEMSDLDVMAVDGSCNYFEQEED